MTIVFNMNRGLSFRPKTLQKSQVFKKQTEKSIQQKGWIHLLFSGLENKGRRPHVLTAEEQTTTSVLLKTCSWKRWIPRLTLSRDQKGIVTWESSSNTVRGDHYVYSPSNTFLKVLSSILNATEWLDVEHAYFEVVVKCCILTPAELSK